jgi:hypothetical protein
MSGYTPVFRTVFEGSLCGLWPDSAAWLCLLALSDKNGCVDKTPQYIAAVTGMPLDELQACIARFTQPDPASRSHDEEGRRLVPIDPARPWGWRIVNHSFYREKARKAAYDAGRTESGKDAQRKRQARRSDDVPTRPDASRAGPLSDTNTNTNTNTNAEHIQSARADSVDPISAFAHIREAYPEFAGQQGWINAQHACNRLVSSGVATWDELIASTRRYAAYCSAGGVSGPKYVRTPQKFFAEPDGAWAAEWEAPKTKAETRLDSNLAAAAEAKRRITGQQ